MQSKIVREEELENLKVPKGMEIATIGNMGLKEGLWRVTFIPKEFFKSPA